MTNECNYSPSPCGRGLGGGAVILAAGSFPTHPYPLSLLQKAEFLCCCDSAAQALIESGLRLPDAIVGDGDSLPQAFKEQDKDRLHLISEQDDNDLTKATRFCISLGYDHITYLGTMGRREDHAIGNFALLMHYFRYLHIHPTFVTDYGTFTPCHGDATFHVEPRQQVSIFNFSCHHLFGTGLRWAPYAFTELWQGTLNEAISDTVTLSGDGDYIVYITFDKKV